MHSNYERALPRVLVYEGGFTDDRRDPGNWTGGKVGVGELKGTKKGIAAASFPHLDIKNLTDAQIAEIYRAKYWLKVRGDDLPSGVDFTAFDAGVNSGPSRSVKWLQSVVKVEADGVLGPKTLSAVQNSTPATVIKAHCAKRLGFVKSLAIWNTFGKGWSRRIADVEATALSWVLTKAQMEAEAKKAQDQATKQGGGAVVVTGTGASDQAFNLSGFPWWVVALVVGVLVAVLLIRTAINSQRAKALANAAEGAKP